MEHGKLTRIWKWVLILVALAELSGCSVLSMRVETTRSSTETSSSEPRELFVFLDGSRNDATSETNVWRLFDASNAAGRYAIYIGGVGSEETPFLGATLGLGMEPRILRGYAYLSSLYRPGDKIFILGFSRGAHQARALAGLIAYAGVIAPGSGASPSSLLRDGNKVLELVKTFNDLDFKTAMKAAPDEPPLRPRVESELGIATTVAEVQFLGVWDTVPGSFFKTYGDCREARDDRDGDRYKSGSYPLIRHIAHAVSLDEKRSRFQPILLCEPLVQERTIVVERGFAGAHSDVGGGYKNSSMHLSSLNWMISQINPHLHVGFKQVPGEPFAKPAHWSVGDAPGNWFSECRDRALPVIELHDSAKAYRERPFATLLVKGKAVEVSNPPMCADFEKR